MSSIRSAQTKRKAKEDDVDLDALAAKIEQRVAARVLALLATSLGAAQQPFSDRPGHEPPEFRGRRKKLRAVVPTIPGAAKIGRWWAIPRDAYARWLESQSTTAPPPAANDSHSWTPATALASAGLRPQRGTR